MFFISAVPALGNLFSWAVGFFNSCGPRICFTWSQKSIGVPQNHSNTILESAIQCFKSNLQFLLFL
jgi:hypothetical protein